MEGDVPGTIQITASFSKLNTNRTFTDQKQIIAEIFSIIKLQFSGSRQHCQLISLLQLTIEGQSEVYL